MAGLHPMIPVYDDRPRRPALPEAREHYEIHRWIQRKLLECDKLQSMTLAQANAVADALSGDIHFREKDIIDTYRKRL